MATPQFIYANPNPVEAGVATASAIEVGDLVSISSGNVTKAGDFTWDTNLSTTQAEFVALFLGASAQRKVANVARIYGNGADNVIRVDTSGEWEYDCATANFAVGDLVGPAKDTGNALLGNKVVAVATENLAIGRVTRNATNTTRVRIRILSVKAPTARQS